jgi:hypothetical protein
MAKTVKFVYAMILLLFVFFVTAEAGQGKSFFIFLIFLLYFTSCIISYNFSNIILLSFLITEIIECKEDSDCPISWHEFFWYRCFVYKCKWVLRYSIWFYEFHMQKNEIVWYQNKCFVYLMIKYFISCHLFIVMPPNNIFFP